MRQKPAAIEFQAVTMRYRGVRGGETLAVSDIDLRIEPGAFVALLGPSGCGKSTLLRLAAGLDAPTSGQVIIGGATVKKPRRDVGIVFQRPVLLPWRSAIENVVLPATVHRAPARAANEHAMALMDRVGLHGFEDAYPRELSGGMQARVALARAMSQSPSVLLLDEPFAALDALTREDLGALVRSVWAEHRQTVVFVTHSIAEAISLADRVVVMSPRPGRIVETIPIDLPPSRSIADIDSVAGVTATAAIRSVLRS